MARPKKNRENKNLEQKLKEPAPLPSPGEKERRTNEEIRKDTIGQMSKTEVNPLFVPILKIPFDIWADSVNIEALRLNDKEAYNIALPVTQLVEYYLPKMPGIVYVWAGLVLSVAAATSPRFMLLSKIRKEKREKQVADKEKEKPPQEAQPESEAQK